MTKKSRNKYYIQIILLLILSFFVEGYYEEYFDFHNKKIIISEQENEAKNFLIDASKIEYRDYIIHSTPDINVLDLIVDNIKKAKTRIYIESYIFTEKRISKALIDAKNRGLDIKIILEKRPYGAGSINSKIYNTFKDNSINIVYSNGANYKYNHSKIIIIDDKYFISTGNLSYSTFAYNKDLIIEGVNQNDLSILIDFFNKDFIGQKHIYCNNTIITSPICPRTVFETLINEAQEEIYIYAELISDKIIEDLIINKANGGVKIKILVGSTKKISSNSDLINKFSSISNIEIKAPSKPFIHSKMLLIDNKYIYLGSINFTTNSIQNNREFGLLFSNNTVIEKIKNEFLNIFINTQ